MFQRRLQIVLHTIAKKDVKALQNATTLKQFLNFRIVIRRFIPSFAEIALSINYRLQGDDSIKFELYEKELKAIFAFQEKLIYPPVLTILYAGDNDRVHRCLRRSGWMCITADTTWWDEEANLILVTFAHMRRTRTWFDATRLPRHFMGGTTSLTVRRGYTI